MATVVHALNTNTYLKDEGVAMMGPSIELQDFVQRVLRLVQVAEVHSRREGLQIMEQQCNANQGDVKTQGQNEVSE